MAILERANAQIFYDFLEAEANSIAPVITLINGHTRSSGDFRIMARFLNSRGISCLLLDNRASGKSTVSEPFSLDDMENDVLAVWDILKIESSCLLGISMGGFIAQGIAAKYSRKVSKLFLVSTASGPEFIQATDGAWSMESDAVERKLSAYFAPSFIERNKLLFETMVRQTKMAISNGGFAEKSDMQRLALKNSNRRWTYSQIKSQTFIYHGGLDGIIRVDAAADLQSKIENSKIKIFEQAGHLLLAETPKALYEEIAQEILS